MFYELPLLAIEWGSTQFYVILTVIAAGFIAFCARPSSKGEAHQSLLAGHLLDPVGATDGNNEPKLAVAVDDDYRVVFTRLNVPGLTTSGADSLAVTRISYDLSIKERVSAGYSNDPMVPGACFVLESLAPDGYYHVHWVDEESGLWTAFTLHVTPGMRFERDLRR